MKIPHKSYYILIASMLTLMLTACTENVPNGNTVENIIKEADSTNKDLPNESVTNEEVSNIDIATQNVTNQDHFMYRFASKDEAIKLLESNKAYFAGFTQYDLDYRMQKKNASPEEYLTYAKEQVLEFSETEKELISAQMLLIENTISEKGYNLSLNDEIIFVKTTQAEECYSSAYTHGTQIYLGQTTLTLMSVGYQGDKDFATKLLLHEIFHCLTRTDPEFRKDMYQTIHFTIADKDFEIPASVKECFITNPDVERHDSYASFSIDGKAIDCFTALVATKPFERKGDHFFNCMETALIPIDGRNIYYLAKDAENFAEIFGTNTDYVIDPEECLADNFSYAMVYGMNFNYSSPEIIEKILALLSK